MCGRYALHAHPDVIALQFALSTPPEFKPRYNIAPSSHVLIVREDKERGRLADYSTLSFSFAACFVCHCTLLGRSAPPRLSGTM